MSQNGRRKELTTTTGSTANTAITYYGYSMLGSDESAYVWLLEKQTDIIIDSNNVLTKVEYPSGTTSYSLSWTERNNYYYQ